jgi:hypothetical protein
VSDIGSNGILCKGLLQNTNTLEAFKDINKQNAINKCGEQIWNDILSGAALSNPGLLTRFLLLTFAVTNNVLHKHIIIPLILHFLGFEKISILLLVCLSNPGFSI